MRIDQFNHTASGSTMRFVITRFSTVPDAIADDERHMRAALDLAREAADDGEVPVGALVIIDGAVVGTGRNRREHSSDPTAHAEMIAIREAAAVVGQWRLNGATLYVTLEPCVMCGGALLQARVDRVVYGAMDMKAGAMGSLYNVACDPRLNHQIDLTVGVLADECGSILTEYFDELRADKAERNEVDQ